VVARRVRVVSIIGGDSTGSHVGPAGGGGEKREIVRKNRKEIESDS
jgi:hypothetical protein